MIHKSLIYKLSMLIPVLLLSAGSIMASPPVVMKLLILAWDTNDQSYLSLTRDLGQIGVPYQTVFVNNLTADGSGNRLTSLALTDSTSGNGLYQGIIETDSSFDVCTTVCTSLLSATDVSKLNTYASQYNVRMVCYYGWPETTWGLQPGDSGASYTATSPLNVTVTAAGAAVFPYLTPAATIPVSGVWAYRALPIAAANETTTPILMAGAYTVGVTHTTADGRQTLALTMDNYPAFLHSMAFSYGVVNWVTNGVFLGSRRVYLNPETDDLMLGNGLYAPTLSQCPGDPSCPVYFSTTGADLQGFAKWQANLKLNPQFQSFYNTFAYNGIGTTWFAPGDPVFSAIASLSSQFTWVSHTWDHANLDCYTTDSSGNCVPATLAQSLAELNQNIPVAPSLGITLDKIDMVTPFNGGLTNPNFVQAAAQAGLKYIVYAGDPPSTQTGLVNPFVPSIFEITRREPDMYYDVSSPLTGVYGSWPDEYNAEYGPAGTTPTYTSNQTYTQILDNMSDVALRTNMLSYEPYPLAFHMDNLYLYDGTHSIISDFLDATITKYTKIFSIPVLTLDMNAIAPLLQNRASYDASGVVGVYTPGVSVVLTTTSAATIPVTGACSQAICSAYAGQIQDNVVMAANSSATLSLTAVQGVALTSLSLNPASVTGGSSATGTVTMTEAAPVGGASILLSGNNSSAIVPATVTVAAGKTTATFTVTTTAVTTPGTATITASYNGVSKTAALAITAPTAISSLSLNPATVTGGASSTGTVSLSAVAPSGGISIGLSSNNAAVTVPANVVIAAGSTTATFTVATTAGAAASTATITASYNGLSKTAGLTITASTALSSVSLNPATVTRGASSTGTITLSNAAPSGGVSVALSSNSTAAIVPATVTVAAGSTTATFTVTTTVGSAAAKATITATFNKVSKTAALTLTASSALSSLSLSPASVPAGVSSLGTITLTSAAPSGGILVVLSSNSSSAGVPASVTVPAGSATTTFTITTLATASSATVTLKATYNGVSKTATLTITTVKLSSLSVSPTSVVGGTSATGLVSISSAAPTGGAAITLKTSNTLVASVPASVTIAAGSTTATFAVTTKATTSSSKVTITATRGTTSKTASLTVKP